MRSCSKMDGISLLKFPIKRLRAFQNINRNNKEPKTSAKALFRFIATLIKQMKILKELRNLDLGRYRSEVIALFLYFSFSCISIGYIFKEYIDHGLTVKIFTIAIWLPTLTLWIVKIFFKFNDNNREQSEETENTNNQLITNETLKYFVYTVNVCVILILLTCIGVYFLITRGYQDSDVCHTLPISNRFGSILIGIAYLAQAIGDVATKNELKLLKNFLKSFPFIISLLLLPTTLAFFSLCGENPL